MSSGDQRKRKLQTVKIQSDEGKSFNYLAHENDDGVIDVYLCAMDGSHNSYKAEVTPAILATLVTDGEERTAVARSLLFVQEADIVWCIETTQAAAKVTWKKNLSEGMKLKLGSLTMVEHPSAPSDMLSICSAALQTETTKTSFAQSKCESLEQENSQLRRLAEEAVQARELVEADLISKFVMLLNEKKAKIRALQELLEERRAEDLNGATGAEDAHDISGTPEDTHADPTGAREDADDPGSDVYDQDTDVDSGGEEGAAAPAGEAVPGPSGVASKPPPKPQSPPANDSLEITYDALDDPLPVPPKRSAPPAEPPEPPPGKRRPVDCDDLLDLI